jgi:long-chain acyl-CoA synthetase
MAIRSVADVARVHGRERGNMVALHVDRVPVSYATLDARSNRVASAMQRSGIGSQDRVAFLGKATASYFEFLVGAAKLNAVPVPLNWRLASREIAEIVNDSETQLLLVTNEFADVVDEVRGDLAQLREVVALDGNGPYTSYRSWLGQESAADPGVPTPDGDIAIQLYTSGTTGRAKGVLLSHSALMALVRTIASVARIGPDSVSMTPLPMFHIGGTAWTLAGLVQGCQTCVLPRADPVEMLETIANQRVTVAFMVPATMHKLLDTPELPDTNCSSVKTLYYGASPIAPTLLRRALDTLHCDFVQGFGLTECSMITSLGPEHHDAERRPDLLLSCGRPVAGAEVRLVDPDTGRDVSTGEVGEVWVRSAAMMSGYFKRPEETQAAITEDGWLRTGDAARADSDGFYYISDRFKDMIISGGENVYSSEVENVLSEHTGVKECAVIGVESERWGETVQAVVVRANETEVSEGELIEFCRGSLAHYKCPTSVAFLDELPRNPSGKVIKHELKRRLTQPERARAGLAGTPAAAESGQTQGR